MIVDVIQDSPVGTLWFVWVGERDCNLGGAAKSTWFEQLLFVYLAAASSLIIKMRLDGRL